MKGCRAIKLHYVLASIFTVFFLNSCTLKQSYFPKYPKVSTLELEDLSASLDAAISLAAKNPKAAIAALEGIELLPRELENRRNYVLASLYQADGDLALAFTSFYKIETSYLTRFTLWEQINIARRIGFERIVVQHLDYLIYNFPTEAKYSYELARSYLRQNLLEEAKKQFLAIQSQFPESEYAKGANYYLANLSSDPSEKTRLLIDYVKSSPEGSFADLVASQLIKLENAAVLINEDAELKGKIALAFYHKEKYSEAIKYFSEEGEHWLEQAKTLYELKKKAEAKKLILAKLPLQSDTGREQDEEYVKEAIEYLISISSKFVALQYLKDLYPKMQLLRDKIAWHKAERTNYKEDYRDVYRNYPDSYYAAESMSRVFWKEFKRSAFHSALKLAELHWEKYPTANSHPFVAFWAAKILLEQEEKDKARAVLQSIIDQHPRSYYRFRAASLLAQEKGEWFNLPQSNEFISFPNWNWPEPYTEAELVKLYGKDILELSKARQFSQILALEGEKGFLKDEHAELKFDDDFKMWLYAKDQNHLKAISTAYFALGEDIAVSFEEMKFQYSFPLLYGDLIADEAGQRLKLDPLLVHALIKQESRYQPEIVSKVGAIGLMQMMPYTAKSVATQLKIKSPTATDLMDPSLNIKLGIFYMEEVFSRFQNNMIYAIASYNAGPVAVKRWVDHSNTMDPDLFIEDIPYNETRDYVKKVLQNYWLYKELYS